MISIDGLSPASGSFITANSSKGSILLGMFALTLLYAILSGDLDTLTSKLLGTVVPTSVNNGRGRISSHVATYSAHHAVGVLDLSWASSSSATWLYAIVDAPFTAAKSSGKRPRRHPGDRQNRMGSLTFHGRNETTPIVSRMLA